MAETLAGRRVLITGGTAGIGLAAARHLRSAGASVFVIGRSGERVSAIASELDCGGTSCDVRDFADCETAAAGAAAAMGGIDALIASAGVGIYAPITELSPEDWQAMIDTNLTGTFNACKAALPWLLRSQRADIVTLGSRAGRYAFAGGTGYNTTKFGIQGFSEALFLDVSRHGIAVSLIAPGTVATGFAGAETAEWQLDPADVAEAIAACLASHRRANLNWIELRPARRDG